MTLLCVGDLVVEDGTRRLVDELSLHLAAGEILAIVGASGSGKSLTAAAIMADLPPRLSRRGDILCQQRGAMVFQQPRRALNPVRSIGDQVADVLSRHFPDARGAMKNRMDAALAATGFPPDRAGAYPFELSGGMCQRAAIAIALASGPGFLIADEPTTDLDTIAQAGVMDVLQGLAQSGGLGVLLITHDLALAAHRADRIAVMEAGRVVEEGPARRIIRAPSHPVTQRLLAGLTHPLPVPVPAGDVVLQAEGLGRSYAFRHNWRKHRVQAVAGADVTLRAGEAVGLVGPSGSGKTTLARMLARLEEPETGRLMLAAQDATAIPIRMFTRSPLRRAVQIVLQDAAGSLNPRFTLRRIIADPLQQLCGPLSSEAADQRVRDALRAVALDESLLSRLPHQLSGGQRARAGLARALVAEPRILLLDEATSSLDAGLQAMMLDLIDGIRRAHGLAVLAVTHDMGVVERLCDRVLVMAAGRIVESGTVREVMATPRHDVTRALFAARPRLVSPATGAAGPASGGR